LEASCRRVQLARRFHNDAVRCVALRRRRPRWFRLAGHTWPETVELDDRMPGFATRWPPGAAASVA
jgi:hypothetical protein